MVGGLDTSGDRVVYVYQRTGKKWTPGAALQPSIPVAGDGFGRSVALSANDDTAVVGAPFVDGVLSDTGSAYVFTRSGSTWTQQAVLTRTLASSTQYEFGGAVAVLGSDDVVVGAFNGGQGAVYLYRHTASGWNVGTQMPRPATTKFSYYGLGSLATGKTTSGMTVVAGAADWEGNGAVNIFRS